MNTAPTSTACDSYTAQLTHVLPVKDALAEVPVKLPNLSVLYHPSLRLTLMRHCLSQKAFLLLCKKKLPAHSGWHVSHLPRFLAPALSPWFLRPSFLVPPNLQGSWMRGKEHREESVLIHLPSVLHGAVAAAPAGSPGLTQGTGHSAPHEPRLSSLLRLGLHTALLRASCSASIPPMAPSTSQPDSDLPLHAYQIPHPYSCNNLI